MQSQNMVIRPGESGGSLLAVMASIPILLLIAWESQNLLRAKVFELRIMRYQGRMLSLKHAVENAAMSQSALFISAANGGNRLLKKCLIDKDCQSMRGRRQRYQLFNSTGEKLSGQHRLGSDLGSTSTLDALRVRTWVEIECAPGVDRCSAPAAVRTEYEILQSGKQALQGRILPSLLGETNFSLFSCPAGEYITTIDKDGTPGCAPAKKFGNGFNCTGIGGSFGVDSKGFILCEPIQNLCKADIAFSLVIDRSGSMLAANKLGAAKMAGSQFIDQTRGGDETSIVSFAADSRLDSGKTTTKNTSKTAVNALAANGYTNMTAALGSAEQSLNLVPADRPKIIVFLSDGQHNVGVGPAQKAEELKKAGFRIWTIGFGDQADEALLRRMATSPADYSFAKTAADLDKRFADLSKAFCRSK